MILKQLLIILLSLLVIGIGFSWLIILGFAWTFRLIFTGILFIVASLIVTKLAPQYDKRDRIIGYDDFYIPSMWSINGIVIGTRLIKSRSHPQIMYSFFFFMGVPLFPLYCYCYDFEITNPEEEPICYWGLAKWNIIDIFIIYSRWIGIILTIVGIINLFKTT